LYSKLKLTEAPRQHEGERVLNVSDWKEGV